MVLTKEMLMNRKCKGSISVNRVFSTECNAFEINKNNIAIGIDLKNKKCIRNIM